MDDAADALAALASSPQPGSVASAVAEALAFKRRGRSGRGSTLDLRSDELRMLLASAVDRLVSNGTKRDFAYDHVAARFRVSRATVVRAAQRMTARP
jgi:hypothetical protein